MMSEQNGFSDWERVLFGGHKAGNRLVESIRNSLAEGEQALDYDYFVTLSAYYSLVIAFAACLNLLPVVLRHLGYSDLWSYLVSIPVACLFLVWLYLKRIAMVVTDRRLLIYAGLNAKLREEIKLSDISNPQQSEIILSLNVNGIKRRYGTVVFSAMFWKTDRRKRFIAAFKQS